MASRIKPLVARAASWLNDEEAVENRIPHLAYGAPEAPEDSRYVTRGCWK